MIIPFPQMILRDNADFTRQTITSDASGDESRTLTSLGTSIKCLVIPCEQMPDNSEPKDLRQRMLQIGLNWPGFLPLEGDLVVVQGVKYRVKSVLNHANANVAFDVMVEEFS